MKPRPVRFELTRPVLRWLQSPSTPFICVTDTATLARARVQFYG